MESERGAANQSGAGDRPTILVARREVGDALASKSFRITLVISAVALVALIVIANLGGGGGSDPKRIAVGGDDDPGRVVAAIERLGAGVGVQLEVTTVADDATASAMVGGGDADVAVAADGSRVVTDRPVDLSDGSDLATIVNVLRAELALDRGLRAAGLDDKAAATVRASEPPPVESLRPADNEIDSSRTGVAAVTNILLFLMLQTYGGWVITGVTREKASRVIEVLLAVIRPRQLLIGKVLGVGTVALGHALVLIASAYVAARVVGADITNGMRVGDLAVGLVWFLLGYALYCGAFAAAGSLISRVEDAQGVAFPVMLPILFAYLVSFSAIGGANTLLWVLAFIPPTAVLAMPTLYAIGEAPVWAVLVSMGLTVVAIVVVMLAAAKIYERSILRSGRKVSWRDAIRSRDEIQQPVAGHVAGAAGN